MNHLIKEKYRPHNLNQLLIHPFATNILQKISSSKEFPNIIFAGPHGTGKRTRMYAFLRSVYSDSIDRIIKSQRSIEIEKQNQSFYDDTRILEVTVKSSPHHIEITPSDYGNMDHYVITYFLKDIAQIQVTGSVPFKVVVIRKAHLLSRLAQQALRRTMEQYSSITRLILLADTLDQVIDPIRSRSLIIRTPRLSQDDIGNALDIIIAGEELHTTLSQTDSILQKCNGDLSLAIKLLVKSVQSGQPPSIPWEDYVDQLVQMMYQQCFTSQPAILIRKIRNHLYELLLHSIDPTLIFQRILSKSLLRSDAEYHSRIADAGALYEYRMKNGKHPIMHLEAFCATICAIQRQFLKEECEIDEDDF